MSLSFCDRGDLMTLFPFAEYWWLYSVFLLFVLSMLALDLGVFHRKTREVTFKEAAIWSVVWVTLALVFAVLFYFYSNVQFGPDVARQNVLEFLTGYVIEYSLSIDNIFVFVLVFRYFGIPAEYKHRVLFYGILGALIFRAIFIAAGSALMQFHWVVYLFGGFLIFTGVKMVFSSEEAIEPEKNILIRVLKRFMPVTHEMDGKHFFSKVSGRLHATPLFVALLVLEATDIIFAVDSVPAIFGIPREPLIVFTSNIFAILGLRSMYFMLAGVIGRFHLIKYGLAVVLTFVGLKMVWLNDAFDGKFPVTWSLAIIVASIGLSVVLSFLFPRAEAKEIVCYLEVTDRS